MYYNYTNLCYNEAAPKIEWKLESGSKTIIGYQCKKASCTFRGRKYTAWYTPDIPIYSGPYKFADLPGLIMQISSDDNDYIWTCVGLEKGRPGDMITTYKAHNMKEKVMTREKIMALIKKIYKTREAHWPWAVQKNCLSATTEKPYTWLHQATILLSLTTRLSLNNES